jgi:hypothetical protein
LASRRSRGQPSVVRRSITWESEQIEKALFPDGIPEDTSTPEEKEAAWQEFVAKAKEKGIWRED